MSACHRLCYVISVSYGNDSVAMIQWAHEQRLHGVVVAYCDTGWAAPSWAQRVEHCEAYARSLGFEVARIHSQGMDALVRQRKGWPGNGLQFCTAHLKGIPFLAWLDERDPTGHSVVMVGKRRAESRARRDTPEWVASSEYHGGRKLWHPLYAHSTEKRDALLTRAGFEPLPHRSQECSPCVNANRGDFLLLTTAQIERVNRLEVEIGKPMYRPKRFGAIGIYGVLAWARYGRDRREVDAIEDAGCGAPFGCGL